MLKKHKPFTNMPAIILVIGLLAFISQSCNTTDPNNGNGGNGTDTTSHEYVWQKFTFGGAASSALTDVAIIDENNIYAVGEIYIYDSTGKVDPQLYNVAYWNGINWNVKRITVEFRGDQITIPLEGVFAFSTKDIWFVGSLPIHGNGDNWEVYDLRTMVDQRISLSNAWGFSSNEIYFCGRGGSLVYFNGQSWQTINANILENIKDIFGSINQNLIAFASETKIYKVPQIDKVEPFKWDEGIVRTIWFSPTDKLYTGGDSIYSSIDMITWKNENVPNPKAIFKIRGAASNNIFAAGGFGYTVHFNGAGWKEIEETKLSAGNYEGLAVKDNIVAMVGFEGNSAVITIGKRKNP